MPVVQAHVIVRGRVQGVNYRASLQRQAEHQALSGWVRNRWDGSVEAVLQGEEEPVNTVLAWARVGPRSALVEGMEISWADPDPALAGFQVQG